MSYNYQHRRIPIIRRNCGVYLRWWYNGWHYWLFYQGAINYKTEGEKYRTYGTRYIKLSSGQVTGDQIEAIRSILNSTQIKIYTDRGWGEFRIEAGEVVVLRNTVNAYSMEITGIVGSRRISETGSSPILEIPVAPPPEYCELIIGEQIWMCKNWDAAYPMSKVYDNNEANRSLLGGLYTYDMILTSGFCPEGWHIPSLAEWNELITNVGGSTIAGRLKTSGLTYWNTPNTGASNYKNFDIRGVGYFYNTVFQKNKDEGIYLTSDLYESDRSATRRVQTIKFTNDSAAITVSPVNVTGYYPLRLISNKRNILSGGYGLLYNWYVVGNIANTGWHVPSLNEYQTLETYLGGSSGGRLKEAGYIYWNSPNTGAINDVGFNGVGAGIRINTGVFLMLKVENDLWSTTVMGNYGMTFTLTTGNAFSTNTGRAKNYGASIRLVKDSTTLTHGQTGTYVGNDGTVYPTICIGTQEWLAINLYETKYQNGDTIPEVTDDAAWAALTTGALCVYNNDWGNK